MIRASAWLSAKPLGLRGPSDLHCDLEKLRSRRILRTAAVGVAWLRRRGRVVTAVGFTLVTITACVLLGQRLTDSSWPLAHARMTLVAPAALCYFASFI